VSSDPDYMLIFTDGEPAVLASDGRRGLGDALKNAAAKTSEVTISTLQANMCRFLSSLDIIISTSPKEVGGLTLEEVEIHAQIDSKGNIGISAIAGGEVAAHGGIKLVLRKKR
jgi:hypothetical protein